MRIILTHEQADFDAVASQLGAYLLDEGATPVLPRRLNHNVRAFLLIYGVELPFIEQRDLPNQPIEAITLVDTQSLISLKGTKKSTPVSVIDHHPMHPDLPAAWHAVVQPTGATTTLMVEAIRERAISMGPIRATLLLLGIYEDTGSLTYTRTTARDLHAAAFLLSQGASLQIASDFLNHPLSLSQQAIYDQLRAGAETLTIHGHQIIVACGDSSETNEELSTIAHKLRDLLDPDGLFLLVTIRGGIQMIARSTNDQINVGEVARHFGGGGHLRAAAALIKDRPREEVYRELLEVLPRYIHPAITVSQIMSRGPQLLSPETPLEEALNRMQRYGYEGYPVVEDGRVIGLLTRRAVDRAAAHKLNLPARDLMKAGTVIVRTDDSIEVLQNRMTDSGWGQIPVVDPESSEIVGIVTRTDLLKTLTSRASIPGRHNLSARLERALPPAHLKLLKTIANVAHQKHNALYIVGGFVRDLLLDRPSLDFDLVVEGDAIALAKSLAKQYGGRVTSHGRFGTAKWFIRDIQDKLKLSESDLMATNHLQSHPLPKTIDLITARTEFYTYPTALPVVERGSIKLDLHRRDFTINTLALRLDSPHYGEMHDHWGGFNDLRQGLIRVLHSISFVDDPTRMLRAVRFEQRFEFRIEDRTLELLLAARNLLNRVSGDRIRHELDAILDEPGAPQMLTRLAELDLLTSIHEALPWNDWVRDQIARAAEAQPGPEWNLPTELKGIPRLRALAYTLWMLRVPVDQARSIARRLKIPALLEEVILAAAALWVDLPLMKAQPPSKVVARLDEVPLLAAYAVYLATSDETLQQALYSFVTRWRHVKPTITGDDLRARNLPPSPLYRAILTRLRAAWLDGEVQNPEEEHALLETLLKENGEINGLPGKRN